MMSPSDHSVFVYMYRDAANYKVGGALLLEGVYNEATEKALHECCGSWDHFVAEQVGIPTLYAGLYQYSNGPTIDDIASHEFQHLRPATQEDVSSLPQWGTLDRLLAYFRSVCYWDCTLSPHCW